MKSIQSDSLFQQWAELGYFHATSVIEPQRCNALLTVCDEVKSAYLQHDVWSDQPGDPDGRSIRFLEHPSYHTRREGQCRLLELFADSRIRNYADAVLGEPAMYRCSTLWFEPETKHLDGNWHRDGPLNNIEVQREVIGRKQPHAGVQLMLTLIPSSDNEYVPRSHLRCDTPEEAYLWREDGGARSRSDEMPNALRFHMNTGDISAFNPYGLHRGRYHTDKKHRTLMITYTTAANTKEDRFTAAPWFATPGFLDDLTPDAREFYQRFVDRYTAYWHRVSALNSDGDP